MIKRSRLIPFALTAAVLAVAVACSSMQQFQAMSLQERAEYIGIADKMSVAQRKEYLAKGNRDARLGYLKEIGLYEEFVGSAALKRLDHEKKEDFLRAYMNASPEEVKQFMAAYDADTRDRISHQDLQFGWDNKQVILSLGSPADILENNSKKGTHQLWVYDSHPEIATYVYFENGKLTNWAK